MSTTRNPQQVRVGTIVKGGYALFGLGLAASSTTTCAQGRSRRPVHRTR